MYVIEVVLHRLILQPSFTTFVSPSNRFYEQKLVGLIVADRVTYYANRYFAAWLIWSVANVLMKK